MSSPKDIVLIGNEQYFNRVVAAFLDLRSKIDTEVSRRRASHGKVSDLESLDFSPFAMQDWESAWKYFHSNLTGVRALAVTSFLSLPQKTTASRNTPAFSHYGGRLLLEKLAEENPEEMKRLFPDGISLFYPKGTDLSTVDQFELPHILDYTGKGFAVGRKYMGLLKGGIYVERELAPDRVVLEILSRAGYSLPEGIQEISSVIRHDSDFVRELQEGEERARKRIKNSKPFWDKGGPVYKLC